MNIDWLFLVPALLLLLPPLPLGELKRRLHQKRALKTSLPGLLAAWRNWVDLIRSGAGVFLLMGYGLTLDPELESGGVKVLAVNGAILALALLLQTIRMAGGKIHFFAPIFYVSGLTMVLSGPVEGGFALFVGWLFLIGSGNPVLHLPLTAAALGAGGYVIGGLSPALLLNGVLIFIPPVLGLLFQNPLIFVSASMAPQPPMPAPIQVR